MGDLGRDLRYSLRMLLKNPVFSAAAVLTLALGIGLNAATFSAIHGILLKPLSGTENPAALLQLYRAWPGMDYGSTSIPHFQDLRDRTGEVFENTAAWYFQDFAITADDRSERLIGMMVNASFFQTYGVRPLLGRGFLPGVEDRDPGAHSVAVLGYGFWQGRFGGDPAIVGKTVNLGGHPFQIVGVAPEDFKGPVNFAAIPIYIPLMMQPVVDPGFNRIEARSSNNMNVVARLRDGVSQERAEQVLAATLLQLRDEFPGEYETQRSTIVVPQMEAGIHPSFRTAQVGLSAVIMGVVTLLLLIACVNVANLFLSRASERRREMGIRLSLGAGRGRIIRQLLTESMVFSAVAGAAGLVLAQVAVGFLGQVKPPMDGPWQFSVEMDSTVFLFAAAVTLLAGVLFGLAPALQAANPNTVSAVKGETDDPGGRSRASRALVVAQMALSLVLLISSGLFLRSLQGATQIDPGFDDPGRLALVSIDPQLQGYDEAGTKEFQDRLLERAAALPEVSQVGMGNWLPLGLNNSDRGVSVPGYEFSEGERQSLQYAYITEGYLEALGVRVLEGRTFTRQDDAEGPPLIMINQRFAERFWPGESALGKTVRTAGQDREVIGVVETGKIRSLGETPTEFMFLPHRERPSSFVSIAARTAGDPSAVLQQLQGLVREMDSGMILAAVGIYGVMAYSVSRRTREIGIRVALGANRSRVLQLVVGDGMRLAVIGAAIGLALALGAAQFVKGLLYNVSAFDPVAFIGVPFLLIAVAALAVYIPGRKAASVAPSQALRSD